MSEQPHLDKPDLRTDAQKFEDAVKKLVTTPKEAVQARMDAEREQRKQSAAKK
jgi:hypothetical protein